MPPPTWLHLVDLDGAKNPNTNQAPLIKELLRIIPCLDVKDGRVVKGVQFRNHRDLGSIEEHAVFYRDQGADELVFL